MGDGTGSDEYSMISIDTQDGAAAAVARDPSAALALRFLTAFWHGDVGGALALCAPGARFVFARSLPYPRHCPMGEAHTLISTGLFAAFDPPGGFSIQLRNILSDGRNVTVEYSASGRLANGRDYANDYIMALSIEDGRVVEQRAYTDTQHLARLFGP